MTWAQLFCLTFTGRGFPPQCGLARLLQRFAYPCQATPVVFVGRFVHVKPLGITGTDFFGLLFKQTGQCQLATGLNQCLNKWRQFAQWTGEDIGNQYLGLQAFGLCFGQVEGEAIAHFIALGIGLGGVDGLVVDIDTRGAHCAQLEGCLSHSQSR